ncbi:uracil-DNA glycosylase [Candidatus Woesebacteria bacterium]|nr:uracil-DNA glycosylase [Candidatus Woesebacteria bacterium]
MSKREELQKLKEKMEEDQSLPLKKGATRLVFGVGDPNTKILFIGEGPGYWEDQKGEPFVGNAGSFLNQLLSSIKLDRQAVYITNVVHHRPPNNRDPEPSEIAAYGKYLDEIITTIDPKVIVTLGRFSMGKFLPGARISSVHGKVNKIKWKGKDIVMVPMYHPAAALRNGEVMRQAREDFLILPKVLEEASQPVIKQDQLI